MSDSIQLIACNYLLPTSASARGTLAYVSRMNPGGGDDRIMVVFRSRGGRWVEKWESIKRLGSFRLKTIDPESPRYSDRRLMNAPGSSQDVDRLIEAAL